MSGSVLTLAQLMTQWADTGTIGRDQPINIRDLIISLLACQTTTQSGTSYTFALTDAFRTVEFTSATAVAATIPQFSSVPWITGTILGLLPYGAGQLTIVAGTGVTIRTSSSLTSRAQYSTLWARYRGSDEWIVGGELT